LTGSGSTDEAPIDKVFLQIRSRVNDEPIGLCLYALRPESTLHAFGDRSLAMLMIYDPHQKIGFDPFILAACFDLSPGEAKVAVALAEGMSPEEIAKKNRVAISTVRTQLKSVFLKTGANRQAELVSMMARLPVGASRVS
jgi:DNA-binding CsgD family transcriptional regulator